MEEKKDALIEEGACGHFLHGGGIGFDALTSGSEPVKGIVLRQANSADDGDVGFELGPTELRSEPSHQLLELFCYVLWWYRPH